LRKYNTEKKENLNQLTEELKYKFLAKTQLLPRNMKKKPSDNKIRCLGQTARNFKTVLGRHIPM